MPEMRDLIHFAAKPLVAVLDTPQEPTPDHKPKGLWVSVGESWAKWCQAEDFHTSELVVLNRIELASAANILRISTAKGLDRFTEQYADHTNYPACDLSISLNRRCINWARVAERFDGILITPYVWSRRLTLAWYYGWDCASGCIWNASAIAGIDTLDPRALRLLSTSDSEQK